MADRDAPDLRLRLGLLRDRDRQHAVLERGVDIIRIDLRPQLHRALKLPMPALAIQRALALGFLLAFSASATPSCSDNSMSFSSNPGRSAIHFYRIAGRLDLHPRPGPRASAPACRSRWRKSSKIRFMLRCRATNGSFSSAIRGLPIARLRPREPNPSTRSVKAIIHLQKWQAAGIHPGRTACHARPTVENSANPKPRHRAFRRPGAFAGASAPLRLCDLRQPAAASRPAPAVADRHHPAGADGRRPATANPAGGRRRGRAGGAILQQVERPVKTDRGAEQGCQMIHSHNHILRWQHGYEINLQAHCRASKASTAEELANPNPCSRGRQKNFSTASRETATPPPQIKKSFWRRFFKKRLSSLSNSATHTPRPRCLGRQPRTAPAMRPRCARR